LQSPKTGSLAVIFLTVFIDLLGFGMVLPLLPIYAKQYSTDSSGMTIGLIMSSFSAMQFLFSPLWGRLSDRIGRRPVLMVGLAGSVVFYGLFGIATVWRSLTLLFVSRIGAGITGATISTAQAYIADTTTAVNRTRGMALIGAAFGLGFTFGPLFGYLALPSGRGDPGPGPGYAAAGLSAVALLLAALRLPESWSPDKKRARHSWLDPRALHLAAARPQIGLLLLTSFVCVFSFANFESTLSLLIKNEQGAFRFDFREVCLTFAYVGVVLAFAQGFLVRRLSKVYTETALSTCGALIEIAGFALLAYSSESENLGVLMGALAVLVCGFAFITPSLYALLSKRSDPADQGAVLGLSQSVGALARIVGPVLAIRMFHVEPVYPAWMGAGLMVLALALILIGAKTSRDSSRSADR
jgi:MFS family permease